MDAHRSGGGLVALYLLRMAYIRRTDELQMSSTKSAELLRISRSTFYRHLKGLEAAGLVQVDRKQRRWPKVRLLGDPLFRAGIS
jgi:DNA-binding IclR family transcriptional regulator